MRLNRLMKSHQIPVRIRQRHFIALALLMVMVCSLLLVAFHHHDGEQDHDDDCAICAVAHHRTADITISFPDVNYLPFTYPTFFAVFVLVVTVTRFCHSPKGRAPPV